MKKPGPPLFLVRQSYRRKRLMDAARALPVLGAFLVALPALWPSPSAERVSTSSGAIYVFAVWAILIVIAFALARRLAPEVERDPAATDSVDTDLDPL